MDFTLTLLLRICVVYKPLKKKKTKKSSCKKTALFHSMLCFERNRESNDYKYEKTLYSKTHFLHNKP